MRYTSRAAIGLGILKAAVALSIAGCEWKGEELDNDRIGGVTVGVVGANSSSDAFLTMGDVDTAVAAVVNAGWPDRTLYESRTSQQLFIFNSSDPGVATVSSAGLVETRGIGTTLLTASYEGFVSPPVRLSVSPPAVELRASPLTIDAAVGDSVALTVTAYDSTGASVGGVIFNISPDTSYWAVTSVPREGTWRLVTPLVLHLRANLAGSVRLTAYSQNDRPERRLATHPVAVTVHDP